MEITKLIEISDEILRMFAAGDRFDKRKIMGNRNIYDENLKAAYNHVLDQLVKDGYLTDQGSIFSITPVGERFISDGGYVGEIIRKNSQAELSLNLHLSTLKVNKSVTQTNDATQNIYSFQRTFAWITSIIAIVAVLVALIPVFKDDDNAQMKTLIQQQNQKFDSMVKVQQKIEQHLSRITTDTLHLPVQLPSGGNNNLPKSR